MLALSEIMDFLLALMRDENARAAFEQDPQGTLARAGLEGVTAQDVSDARLLLADSGAVRSEDSDSGYHGGAATGDGADPVQQISYTTQHYHVEQSASSDGGGAQPDPGFSQNSTQQLSIDDRDSFFFQTFTSDDDVTIIDDSFNTIDNSSTDVALTNIEATNSFNEGSFTSDDDVVAIDADNSFNSSDDDVVTAIQDNDTVNQDTDVLVAENSFNETEAPDAPLAAVSPPSQLPPAEPAPAPEDTAPEDTAPEDTAADDAAPEEPPAEEPALDDPPIDDDPADDAADPAEGDGPDVGPV
ncbi:MAG TPA: IniB N-terminal domain-containing protein [Pseudonocardia sp.]|nr:IniB N-terminal domain-containing protein [Pseudonocardia sp.]